MKKSTITKKILVTGGAGYIGSHTCVALAQAGYVPVIVDNFSNSEKRIIQNIEHLAGKKIPVHAVDCNDPQALQQVLETESGIVGAIHFAAYKSVEESIQYPEKYYDNNVGSLKVLTELLKANGINNLVFSSSATVYGIAETMPVTETTPFGKAESPYGHTKQLCEELLEKVTGLNTIALRYFNPVGAHPSGVIGENPQNTPTNLVPVLMEAAMGQRGALTVFGTDYDTPDGSCLRDFIHVCDLADAHVKALQYLEAKQQVGSYQVYNVGTGKGSSVLELLTSFTKVTGQAVPHHLGERRPGDIPVMYADTTKIYTELGWKAQQTMEDALRDAWRWWENASANKRVS